MQVIAITVGNQEAGSTYFRLVQYQSLFASKGIELRCIEKNQVNEEGIKNLSKVDCVINQKCLLPLSISKKIVKASRCVIFDFDDAIFTRPLKAYSYLTQLRVNARIHFWLQNAHCVSVANKFLMQFANKYASSVCKIPMALDLEMWKPSEKKHGSFTIGWAGAPVNLCQLEAIDGQLKQVLECYPQVKFAVFCGKKPSLSIPFDYTPFQAGKEAGFVQQLDVGLLPLTDDIHSRGKSPIKALQYLSCGVPVVGNVIGASKEILSKENSIALSHEISWEKALKYLVANPIECQKMGARGLDSIKKYHDQKRVGTSFCQMLYRLTKASSFSVPS